MKNDNYNGTEGVIFSSLIIKENLEDWIKKILICHTHAHAHTHTHTHTRMHAHTHTH